jgi:hypothetical protein
MFRSWIAIGLLLGPTLSLHAAAPVPGTPAAQPAITVRAQPIEKFLDDARFLSEKFGKPAAAKEFETTIAHAIGVDDLSETGIDRTKPVGVYVIPDADIAKSAVVFMLPVADTKALLGFVGKFEVKAEKLAEDFYSLAMPQFPLPVFVRFAQGYAYVTAMNKEAVEIAQLIAPARMFPAGATAALTLSARPDLLPEPVRKMALEHFAAWIKEATEDLETDLEKTEFQLIEKWGDQFVNDGREASLKIAFDRKSGELSFDFGVSPKPGTKLATEIAGIKPSTSLFTHVVGPAGAINVSINSHLADEVSKAVAKSIREDAESFFDTFEIEIEDAKLKEEIKKALQTLIPTAESGLFDMAVSLRSGEKRYTGLAALRLTDGKKIEAALKSLVPHLPEDKRKLLKLDAQKVAGHSIHVFEDDDKDETAEKLFGSANLHFAFSETAVVVGFGENAAKLVGETLAAAKPAPAPSSQIDVTAGKLKLLCDTLHESAYGYVTKVLGTEERLRLYAVNLSGGEAMKSTAAVSLQMIVGAGFAIGSVFEGFAMPAQPAVPAVPPPPPPPPPPSR